jgi:nucleoside-diphosphate-sugar epimerase
MNCLVTGAAGFIGSHLCQRLLDHSHSVMGFDAFIPYYPTSIKESNHASLATRANYHFERHDLRSDPLDRWLTDVEYIFHLAAMPGLAQSWTDFDGYWTCNVQATQRLLESVRRAAPRLKRFVYVSTSSVYGRYSAGDESLPTRPISPYGVTKLAAEHLCRAYQEAHGLPLIVLRYFSVYGPRQRPDMAYHRFIEAAQSNKPLVVYGDGLQVRGNTYVDDCVDATLAALQSAAGETYNVGGGETATVWEIVRKIENLAGRTLAIRQEPARPGDQRQTFADTSKIRRNFGWEPKVKLDEGLARQWEWQAKRQVANQKTSNKL